jgi:hypothetical protein
MKLQNLIHILMGIVCIGLLPKTQAAPAPETPDPGAVGGTFNTADGTNALVHVTTGVANAAFGWFSLLSNTDGSFNTGVGAGTLLLNIGNQTTGEGLQNTAVGAVALLNNTTGSNNTAIGAAALLNNTTGSSNTATGRDALGSNTSGNNNNATGVSALQNNNGSFNNAFGRNALSNTTAGSGNNAFGDNAMIDNVTGFFNTAIGDGAGFSITGSGNVCIGASVFGVADENDTTRIRNIYSSAASGRAVFVDSDDKLGTLLSTRRVKDDIKPMDKTSKAILALKPVSFRYKKEVERSGAIQFGLIAEEVAEVSPDLVILDAEGKPESVRYEAINAMLLNEFLKEHRKVEEQDKTIAELKSGMTALAATVKEQAAQIQKVSAQLEASKPAPQVVKNP